MPIDPKQVKQLARAVTDDPDVFNETAWGAVAAGAKQLGKKAVEAGKACAADPECRDKAVKAGKWAVEKGKQFLDSRKKKQQQEVPAESYTNKCRNRVHRRGGVMSCGRMCNNLYCEDCTKALAEVRNRLLGLSEAKKEPSNKPDDLEVDDSFEVHDDYDEKKKEPGEPGKQKRKSSLQDGPKGEEGSKKKPYLESREEAEAAAQRLRNAGLGLDRKKPGRAAPKKAKKAKKPSKADAEAAAQRLRDAGLGLD